MHHVVDWVVPVVAGDWHFCSSNCLTRPRSTEAKKKKNVLPPLVCFENPRFFMLGRNNYDIIVRCKYITHRLHWCFFFNPSISQQNHKTITSHLTKTSSQKYISLLYQHNSCWWKTVVSETFFLLTVNRGKKKLWFWNKATSLIYKDLVEKA